MPAVRPKTDPVEPVTDMLPPVLLHVPPVSASVNVVDAPSQMNMLPFIGWPFTVTVAEMWQPIPSV